MSSAKWRPSCLGLNMLNETTGIVAYPTLGHSLESTIKTQCGRVMHIYANIRNVFGPYDGLSLVRHQAIIWTNADLLRIGP